MGQGASSRTTARPDGIRIGPAPLSTSFGEVYRGLSVLRDLMVKQA